MYVITGASGAGKSTLVAALKEAGFAVMHEAALEVLKEQQECGGTMLPWTNRAAFFDAVLARNVQNYRAAQSLSGPVFFDRGAHECLAWLQFSGIELRSRHVAAAAECKYSATVFVPEPWPEIYAQTADRPHSFARAARSFESTVAAYTSAGYVTTILPKTTVRERVSFVIETLTRLAE